MSGGSLFFSTLTFKNFLSWGNTPTTIDLSSPTLSVVMGENMDTGGEDSKNGVGKSAICDALTYVIYGRVVRDVTNQGLFNKFALKGHSMLVTLEFSKGDKLYLIERGEKPSILRFYEKPVGCFEDFHALDGKQPKFERTKSSKPETTNDIIDIIGLDIKLFEYIVMNSSESDPFMKLAEDKKRDLIEKLFGFDILSAKAKALKEDRKEVNKQVIAEESRVNATEQANQRIQREIDTLRTRETEWEKNHTKTVTELREMIEQLAAIDVDSEIEVLKMLQELTSQIQDARSRRSEAQTSFREAERTYSDMLREAETAGKRMTEIERQLESMDKSECPTCGQHWEVQPEKREVLTTELQEHDKLISGIMANEEFAMGEVSDTKKLLEEIDKELLELRALETEAKQIELFYDSIEEATTAGATRKQLEDQLAREQTQTNPHTESIQNIQSNALVRVDRTELKELQKLAEHYQLLIDLLTNKDSYIRKAIIDRWLPKLNTRIAHYLESLELPHRVRFHPDLTMEIANMGKEYGWGNLSRGQRQRVTLALNFAFQDVFEYMNYRINTLFVDELIDNGICARGAENAVTILKKMCDQKQKRVLLVTHRDDIASRVEDQIHVVLRNNQSRIREEQ